MIDIPRYPVLSCVIPTFYILFSNNFLS
jgi:hypothetical protein